MRTGSSVLIVWLLVALVRAQAALAGEDPAAGGAEELALPKEAVEAIEAGDWETVAAALKPLTEGEAEPSEQVSYWYGVALYEQGEHGEAAPHLAAALEANTQSLATARYLARAGYETLSIELIEQALAAFPDDPVVLTAMGRYYFRLFRRHRDPDSEADNSVPFQHLEKAIDYLRRAVAVDPSNAEAHLWLATALDWYNKHEAAIRHLLIADRLEPLGYDAYVLLGRCYKYAGDHSNAADAYAAAAESSPANAHLVDWSRGMALWRAGRSEEAVEVFREIFRRDHKHYSVRFMLGRAAYDAGDYALALFAFRESYRADENLDALAWTARCAYDMGQDDLAVSLIGQAIEEGQQRMPEGQTYEADGMWHFVRGRSLWQLGEKKRAVLDLNEATSEDPSNEEYATWAVYAFRQLKDPVGIVRVAHGYGLNGHPKEALEVIGEVMEIWRVPPLRLPRQVDLAIAGIYEELGLYRGAWLAAQQAGLHRRRAVSAWSSWLAFRASEHEEAKRMFGVLAGRGRTEWDKQLGHHGSAYMGLLRRDAEAARTHAEAIEDERLQPMVPTTLRWAALFAGEGGAADTLDTFDLLGVCGVWFGGTGYWRGLSVQGLIPGSPLAETVPRVKPKDVIIRVGDQWLQCAAGVQNLRKAPPPEGPTRIVVRRGRDLFEVSVDFAAVRAGAMRMMEAEEPAQ